MELPILSLEMVATGVVGLILLGNVIKKGLEGYRDASKDMKVTPMLNAMSLSWDRDQQERFMHLLERLTEANEEQTKCLQGIVDRRQDMMQTTMESMLKRLGEVEITQRKPPR